MLRKPYRHYHTYQLVLPHDTRALREVIDSFYGMYYSITPKGILGDDTFVEVKVYVTRKAWDCHSPILGGVA